MSLKELDRLNIHVTEARNNLAHPRAPMVGASTS